MDKVKDVLHSVSVEERPMSFIDLSKLLWSLVPFLLSQTETI